MVLAMDLGKFPAAEKDFRAALASAADGKESAMLVSRLLLCLGLTGVSRGRGIETHQAGEESSIKQK